MANTPQAIAIIGLGARLPGAGDVARFWADLRSGREGIAAIAEEDLLANGVTAAELADPHYVRRAGQVPNLRDFDAELFGMTPREARFSDPQLKLLLEVAHAAIEDSGYDPTTMTRDVGVFGSAGQSRYTDLYITGSLRHHDGSTVVLNNTDYITTFTSYTLGFTGPGMTVMTACSSSLVATHLACQSLLLGECDVALAGGANVELPSGHGYRWGPGSVRSRDGHCRPFDADSTGTVFSDGAGVVVLKRLSDAIADGDHIRAVIHGSAVNNDGADKMSFGAPSVEGQSAAIVEAMTVAGVSPADVSYVEAHGTATAIGDPVEIASLHRAYRSMVDEDLPRDSIGIGSVKGNIGHTIPTAGVAGLIKLALALDHGELPPSINFTKPNPKLEIDRTPFYINSSLRQWPRTEGKPRWAGISAFGVGGTNAHLVVSEGPAPAPTPADRRPRVVVLSGRTAKALVENRTRIADFLADTDDKWFADAAATLQQGRTTHPVRAAVVAADRSEAVAALRDDQRLITGGATEGEVAFLFPGQGSQHPRMAVGLHGADAVFTAELDRAFAVLGPEFRDRWLSTEADALLPTAYAQPVLFAVEHALAKALMARGLIPTGLVGHSVGELVAATVAGVLDLEDALPLVRARGAAMQKCPPGSMSVVLGPAEEVGALLPNGFTIAAINSSDRVVVAGQPNTEPLMHAMSGAGIAIRPLRTSHGFHSPAMAAAVEAFTSAFQGVELRPPTIPVHSAATGRELTARQATDPAFWAGQLVEPVRFDRALDALLSGGTKTLVEVGPGRGLSALAVRHAAVADGSSSCVPLLPGVGEAGADERSFLTAIAALWTMGHQPDWAALRPDVPVRRVPLPGYPYQRVRSWVDPTTGPAAPETVQRASEADIEVPADRRAEPSVATARNAPGSPFSTVTWAELPAAVAAPPAAGSTALAFLPGDEDQALIVLLALHRAGYQVVRVRAGAHLATGELDHVVRPGVRSDVEAVLETIGTAPSLVLHGWACAEWPAASASAASEHLDLGLHGLHTIVTAVAGRGWTPDVVVATTGALDVSGAEQVHPVKAMLPAQVRSLAAESPAMRFALVDFARAAEDDLAAEFTAAGADVVVAVRSGRRWTQRELAFTPTKGESPLRKHGVYLITGGVGALGRAAARALASTGLRPRLVLTSRSASPEEHAALLAELTALGAQVRVQACDIADPRAVARLLDITAAHFGPVNGVLHLAGVAGQGMLAFRDRDDLSEVCRPKVDGTLVLTETLAERGPLDFLVSFSSRAALAGMVGSGDYAAANAFLDAHAATAREAAPNLGRVLSVGWPAWAGGGMANDLLDGHSGPEYTTTLSDREHWALDEHRVDGKPVLPGTGHLDLVVRAVRAVVDDRPDTSVVLEDVVFAVPLGGTGAQSVRVRFTPDGDRHRFEVSSRPVGLVEDFVTHVTGEVRVVDRTSPENVDVEALCARLGSGAVPVVNSGGTGRMFALGPRWRVITDVWAGDGEKVLRLELPPAFHDDLAEHVLHPSLLDCATAALRDPDTDGLQLPFRYRRLTLHGPLPGVLFSHLRRGAGTDRSIVGDIDLFDGRGEMIARIEGFTMRKVDPAAFADARTTAPPAAVAKGLPADTGTRLLLDLLAARTPAHVLVQPFENGVPAPRAETRAAAEPSEVLSPAEVLAAASGLAAPIHTDAPTREARDVGTGVEDELRLLWAEVLGTREFSSDDDFFDLGGDSMSAVQLMGRIRDVFKVEFGIGAIFDHPSVSRLADLVRAKERG